MPPLSAEHKLMEYGEGPWMDEPDEFGLVASGLPCLGLRNPTMGFWCGYVGIPRSHPLHGLHYDDALMEDIWAHGGITFAGECGQLRDIEGRSGLRELDHSYWWFGFDCGHAGDVIPGSRGMERRFAQSADASIRALGAQLDELKRRMPHFINFDEYRDVAYVRRECCDLAERLAAAAEQNLNSHTFCRGCKSYRALELVDDLPQGPVWLCGSCRRQRHKERQERFRRELPMLTKQLFKQSAKWRREHAITT